MRHPIHSVRSVSLRRDLPTVPGASARALAFGLSFSSLALALRAETGLPALQPGAGTPLPDQRGDRGPTPISLGTAPARGRGELFFIDAAVADPRAFWLAAPAGATVVGIPAGVDSWQFMAQEAEKFHELGAIHLISHGEPGALVLNGQRYTAADLSSRAALLRQLGRALSKNGDILLYGCDTGAGDAGSLLVTRLADFTGADVAASSNPTGAKPGADWNLEITRGTIETPTVAPADYAHTLANFTASTITELRAALATAASNNVADTITITANLSATGTGDMNASPTDSQRTLVDVNVTDGQTLTIVGGGKTIDANYYGRVLEVRAGTVAISNLTLQKGLVFGNGGSGTALTLSILNGGDGLGAGIRNAGTLTLTSVTITGHRASGGGGASFTPDNNPPHPPGVAITYGHGGGGGGGFSGIGGGNGGARTLINATSNFVPAAPVSGGSGIGGDGGEGLHQNTGTFYAGRGGSATGGVGADAPSSSLSGGAGGTAGGIGGGGGGYGNAHGASGRGGDVGGGVFNSGSLTIINSTLSNNAGAGGGGAGATYHSGYTAGAGGKAGGGILNRGTLRMTASTVSAFATNAAQGGQRGEQADSSHPVASSGADYLNDGGTVDPAYVADTTPPTVLSVVRAGAAAQGLTPGTTTASFTVTYSEAVTGVVAANFVIEAINGGTVTGTVGTPTGGPTVYTVPVTLTGGSGEFRLKVIN